MHTYPRKSIDITSVVSIDTLEYPWSMDNLMRISIDTAGPLFRGASGCKACETFLYPCILHAAAKLSLHVICCSAVFVGGPRIKGLSVLGSPSLNFSQPWPPRQGSHGKTPDFKAVSRAPTFNKINTKSTKKHQTNTLRQRDSSHL